MKIPRAARWKPFPLIVMCIEAMFILGQRKAQSFSERVKCVIVIQSSRRAGSLSMNLKERTYLWYLSVLRIYVGFYLFRQGVGKFQRDFPRGDWIGRQIGDISTLNLYSWYKKFLLDYVVPHHELFGYLVMTGEIAVGACLLLGLFTRFSAVVGLLMLINYFLGVGMARGGATLAQQQTFIIALAIFVLANPGRTIGLDGLLFGGGRSAKGAK